MVPVEPRSGYPVAAVMFAAIEGEIGDLQHAGGELRRIVRYALERAQAEAPGNLDVSFLYLERCVGHRAAQLARHSERSVVAGLRQHDGEFLAADARHPVDARAQTFLEARPELLQDLIAAGVPQGLVDLLEMIDIAKNHGQWVFVARRTLDFAGEMPAEESPAGDAREVIGGGE